MAPSRARGEVHPRRAAHDYPEAVGALAPLHTATTSITARGCTRQRGAGAEGSDLARFITARRVQSMTCTSSHIVCARPHQQMQRSSPTAGVVDCVADKSNESMPFSAAYIITIRELKFVFELEDLSPVLSARASSTHVSSQRHAMVSLSVPCCFRLFLFRTCSSAPVLGRRAFSLLSSSISKTSDRCSVSSVAAAFFRWRT